MSDKAMRWIFIGLLAMCAPACAPDYPPIEVTVPVTVPLCTAVSTYGNGQRCVDAEGNLNLALCEHDAQGACSAGRLCFDNALYLSCACEDAVDCTDFTDYVNTAREDLGQTALEPLCEFGKCVGDLDLDEDG